MKRLVMLTAAAALCVLSAGLVQQDTRSLKGQKAPDITLNTLDRKGFTLSKHRGNVVVLDYWATWCPPCRKSLPHFNKLANDAELAERGLRVFAINSRENLPTIQKFIEENNYTFPVPIDPQGKFGQLYRVRGIPTTVIVGRDGTIRDVFVGFGDGSAQQIDRAIEEALAEPAPEATPSKSAEEPAPSK